MSPVQAKEHCSLHDERDPSRCYGIVNILLNSEMPRGASSGRSTNRSGSAHRKHLGKTLDSNQNIQLISTVLVGLDFRCDKPTAEKVNQKIKTDRSSHSLLGGWRQVVLGETPRLDRLAWYCISVYRRQGTSRRVCKVLIVSRKTPTLGH